MTPKVIYDLPVGALIISVPWDVPKNRKWDFSHRVFLVKSGTFTILSKSDGIILGDFLDLADMSTSGRLLCYSKLKIIIDGEKYPIFSVDKWKNK